jgi:RHH-type transcriptional regulator, rel operon repressor / antitoxin RelB
MSVRLPEELIAGLDRLAEATDRSRSYLVKEAIETYLTEYEDYRLAMDRLLDKDDEIISGSELRKRLGI